MLELLYVKQRKERGRGRNKPPRCQAPCAVVEVAVVRRKKCIEQKSTAGFGIPSISTPARKVVRCFIADYESLCFSTLYARLLIKRKPLKDTEKKPAKVRIAHPCGGGVTQKKQ